MSKTVSGLLEHCRQALKNNVKYVYGAKMEVLSYNQIKTMQITYGKSYVWDSDFNKAGKLCCDCSGLISSYTGIIRSSSGYASTAVDTATIAELKANWKKYVGWGIWMTGHIGVVSDTEGYYYAMDGSARNMVHFPINKNSWTKVIKLCDIDYEEADEMTEEQVRKIATQIANDMVYKYVTSQNEVYNNINQVPDWGKDTINKLINKGILKGSEKGLDLSYNMLRLLVINDRAGLY